jgi:hypothetical protein
MILAIERGDGRHVLYLLAVSSKPPRAGQSAIRVPETERRRAGLTKYDQAWVYVSEFNRDVAEDSYYFEPSARRLGVFSPAFVLIVAKALAEQIQANRSRAVDRSD